jgi:DNA modification methylase
MKIMCAHTSISDVDLLVPHPLNPNKHGEKQIEMLAKIMNHQGWRHPITVSKRSGFIVAGHGRLMAAKKLGWETAPVDEQEFDTEADEYAHLIADNKIAELAEHDDAMMFDALAKFPDLDLDLLGIPDLELPGVEMVPQCDPDDVPEVMAEPKVARGEVYILGNHRLMCGDSTAITDVDRLMNGERADMVFTDPPYGIDYTGGHFHSGDVNIKRERERIKNDNSDQIYEDIIPIIAQFCDGPCYTWFADMKPTKLFSTVEAVGEIHALIIWHKTNAKYAAMSAHYKRRHEPCLYWKPKGKTLRWSGASTENTLWELKRDSKNEFHPTQKPVELAERAIGNHDAKKVLDFFGGSGSTLIACEKTNRQCFMMEIDPHYCGVILDRWQKFTGQKAHREDGVAWDKIRSK